MRSNATHGHAGKNTPTYVSWTGMLYRCRNKNCPNYARYGGRGISVCAEWLSFENFLRDMGERPVGSSIERIDNDGNYCPENCRWASVQDQANNRRSSRRYEFNGELMPLRRISEITGLPHRIIQRRILAGWAPAKAFSTPVLTYKQRFAA